MHGGFLQGGKLRLCGLLVGCSSESLIQWALNAWTLQGDENRLCGLLEDLRKVRAVEAFPKLQHPSLQVLEMAKDLNRIRQGPPPRFSSWHRCAKCTHLKCASGLVHHGEVAQEDTSAGRLQKCVNVFTADIIHGTPYHLVVLIKLTRPGFQTYASVGIGLQTK